MSRRWFAVLGAFLVISVAGLAVVTGRPTGPVALARVAGLLLAGVLFVAGGLVRSPGGVE